MKSKKKCYVRFPSLLALLIISCSLNAQVSWQFSSKKMGENIYEVHLTATVEDSWHIYSQTTPKGGPYPTEIKFNKNPLIALSGLVKEFGEIEQYHDKTFKVEVYAFQKEVDFVQVVKKKNKTKTNISGSVTFMACTNQRCLPPQTIKFDVKID